MATLGFRFLHAGDFRLHEVIAGPDTIPTALRDVLVRAPYQSVERVFDVAIAEAVSFVVLSGELLHPLDVSPRGLTLLLEQFERLAEHHIAVYWAGGRSDSPELWPEAIALPENVTYFTRRQWQEVVHDVDGRPLAVLIGRSSGNRSRIPLSDIPSKPHEELTIVAYCGEAEAEALATLPVQYWALGGRSTRRTLIEQPRRIAHYCGSPQARTPQEIEPHGCTLVEVDADGQLQARQVTTDIVRFRTERIFIHDRASPQDVVKVLAEHTRQLVRQSIDTVTLVTWELESGPATAASLLGSGTLSDIWQELARLQGQGKVWTVAIVPLVDGELPSAWYQEDSLLGDYLRTVRKVEMRQEALWVGNDSRWGRAGGPFAQLAELPTDQWNQVLREAALVGAVALHGDSSAPGRGPS